MSSRNRSIPRLDIKDHLNLDSIPCNSFPANSALCISKRGVFNENLFQGLIATSAKYGFNGTVSIRLPSSAMSVCKTLSRPIPNSSSRLLGFSPPTRKASSMTGLMTASS
ncbi:hypothetical protein M422DRAFT_270888 [Sphaerobolus stellatus SS14]|uniref:Unplaced genomic scaffold SPHSTscaffold_246, whole genome shotgun sequence n=1 Tax=Sphaerobolus stellatus (strain SS14) TaxID=990650 RepID=A0A0C9UFY6_SPHS4|nr:hypothetical protein M422DRAFT_270888 [Sphaerobolus stellatus SS14]